MDADLYGLILNLNVEIKHIAESLDRLVQDQAEFYKHIIQKGVLVMDEKRPDQGITQEQSDQKEIKSFRQIIEDLTNRIADLEAKVG